MLIAPFILRNKGACGRNFSLTPPHPSPLPQEGEGGYIFILKSFLIEAQRSVFMDKVYNPQAIEEKWQRYWEQNKDFQGQRRPEPEEILSS